MDDLNVIQEGEELHAASIISLESKEGSLTFPEFTNQQNDPFIQKINTSGEKWIVFTDEYNNPKLVLDADGFLRSELLCKQCEGIQY